MFIKRRQRADLPLTTLYMTQEERDAASQLANIKKADLVKMIEDLVKINDDSSLEFFKEKLTLIQKRLSLTKKEVIISLYEDILQLLERNDFENQENEHEADEDVLMFRNLKLEKTFMQNKSQEKRNIFFAKDTLTFYLIKESTIGPALLFNT